MDDGEWQSPSPLAPRRSPEDCRNPQAGASPLIPRLRKASWSAVAERSGDTAFAPQMPITRRFPGDRAHLACSFRRLAEKLTHHASRITHHVSGLRFQVSPFNSLTRAERSNSSTFQRFWDRTRLAEKLRSTSPDSTSAERFNDSTFQRFKPPAPLAVRPGTARRKSLKNLLTAPPIPAYALPQMRRQRHFVFCR
jgi:hypothetical protein